MNLETLTIKEARRAMDAGEFTSLQLTEAYLEEIKKKNSEINAYLEVWEESAREEARSADEKISRGEAKPLTGIPFAIKDNILISGRIVSCASKILENYRASYDATAIEKLKDQGVVFLGRTNMDEFALGGSTENSAYGPTKNPHDTSRVPGGTSGGSAAAVAARMALVALGSDTGGSVRQPAAFCGVVGIKPTYGKVSRFGLVAAASSLDQIGVVATCIDDAQTVLQIIEGNDPKDSTSLPNNQEKDTVLKRKIGVPRTFLKDLDPRITECFEKSINAFKEKGYEIVDVELPALSYALPVYYIINPAEVSTNLSRFDGIRYGLSVEADTIGEVYAKTKGQGFGKEVRRRIIVGTFVLSSGYVDAYYRKARAVRELIRKDFTNTFESVDVIALPTTPTAAFKLGEKVSDPVSLYLEDIFTVPVNLVGVPAVSIPSGTITEGGKDLPVGIQLIASHGQENILYTVGKDIEKTRG